MVGDKLITVKQILLVSVKCEIKRTLRASVRPENNRIQTDNRNCKDMVGSLNIIVENRRLLHTRSGSC